MIQCDLFQIDWLLNRLKGYLNNGPDFWKWRYGAKDSRKCLTYKINPDKLADNVWSLFANAKDKTSCILKGFSEIRLFDKKCG